MKSKFQHANDRLAKLSQIMEGVEVLAFMLFESPMNNGDRYHALGAYRVNGRTVIRWTHDTFSLRVPATAVELYAANSLQYYDDETTALAERRNALDINRRLCDLPADMQGAISDAIIRSCTMTA